MTRKPVMNSLGAALHSFNGGEVPSSSSLRDLIFGAATACERSEADSEHASAIIAGLLDAYLAACAMEDEDRDDEDVTDTIGFDESEQHYIKSYAAAYGRSLGLDPDKVEGSGWPDYLPQNNRFTRELIIDLGRLVGFLDANRAKAYYRHMQTEPQQAI